MLSSVLNEDPSLKRFVPVLAKCMPVVWVFSTWNGMPVGSEANFSQQHSLTQGLGLFLAQPFPSAETLKNTMSVSSRRFTSAVATKWKLCFFMLRHNAVASQIFSAKAQQSSAFDHEKGKVGIVGYSLAHAAIIGTIFQEL